MTTGVLFSLLAWIPLISPAHRPTFDPARGKEAQRGPAYHQRLQPAHTTLKVRQPGQGGTADADRRDLRAQLLEAEAKHFAKKDGGATEPEPVPAKRRLEDAELEEGNEDEEDMETKRRRVLADTRAIDADSSEDEEDSDEER